MHKNDMVSDKQARAAQNVSKKNQIGTKQKAYSTSTGKTNGRLKKKLWRQMPVSRRLFVTQKKAACLNFFPVAM